MGYPFEDYYTDKSEKQKDEQKSKGRVFWEYLRLVLTVCIVGFLLQNFVIVNAQIPSASMEDTIMTGERLIGNRLAYLFGDADRYDIIIFKYPDDESQLFIKRVIGLPGETIIISGGKVYAVDCYTDTSGVSDESLIEDPLQFEDTIILDDSFIKEPMDTDEGLVFRIPEDSYFVMGDNRNNSLDSRYWQNSFVTRDQIVGEAMFRYWPLNKISLLGYEGGEE